MRRAFGKAVRGNGPVTIVYITVSLVAFVLVAMLWYADHRPVVDLHACQSVCAQERAFQAGGRVQDPLPSCPQCPACPARYLPTAELETVLDSTDDGA